MSISVFTWTELLCNNESTVCLSEANAQTAGTPVCFLKLQWNVKGLAIRHFSQKTCQGGKSTDVNNKMTEFYQLLWFLGLANVHAGSLSHCY